MATSTRGGTDTADLITEFQADFDRRLAAMAAEPQQWVAFVEQVAVFGAQYSFGNQLLLMMQAEQRGVTPRFFLPYGRTDGSSGWRAHGRQVRAGEKAFKVWAPIRRRPTAEEIQRREAAGRPVSRDSAGRPVPQLAGFRLASTFEVSQTDGDPFEPPTVARRRRVRAAQPQLLTGPDPTGAFDDIAALITARGYTVALVPPGTGYLGSANGITVTGADLRVVQVREDLEPVQRTKTLLHELAHLCCGHTDGPAVHRGRQETEAESVTHVVLRALGVDSAAYSDAYVFGWADGDLDLVRQCADTVIAAARQVLDALTAGTLAGPPAAAEAG